MCAVKNYYITPETASSTASYRGEFSVSRRISYGSSLLLMNIFMICTEKPEQRMSPGVDGRDAQAERDDFEHGQQDEQDTEDAGG